MSVPVVEIAGLCVQAGPARILEVAEFVVNAGELVGVLGPNGAGKSTLLRCLLGMQRHAGGGVRMFGQDLGALGWAELARLRRRIGYVPQPLPGRTEAPLTVREVVAVGRSGLAGLFRPLRREDWRVVDAWLERLGLAALAARPCQELSGGEQRKMLLARAMAQEPELLLLDEPAANLDLGWRERLAGTIQDLHRDLGLTTLLVCHEVEVLPAACRRLVILRQGRVEADGAPGALLTPERIARLYGPGLACLARGGRLAVVPAEVAP
jgi:iron complex transport system ATP-binding protein